MDTSRSPQSDLSDLLGRVRRQWWLVALPCVAGVVGAAAYTQTRPEVYSSSASVLVSPVDGVDSPPGSQPAALNLDTESQLVRSTAVAALAGRAMRVGTPPERLAERVRVDVPAGSQVLVITYSAGTAQEAQAGARGFAEAYLQARRDAAAALRTGQIAAINAKVALLMAEVDELGARISASGTPSATRASLDSQRTGAMVQVNMLATQANLLTAAPINPGRVIIEANLPARPNSPALALNLAAAAAYALVLGVFAAILRDHLARRIRHGTDLGRRTGVPVLAAFPGELRPPDDDVVASSGAAADILNRLRNEVRASLRAGPGTGPVDVATGPGVIVVTGASPGPGAALVATNLAAAFARTGSDTILLSADAPRLFSADAPRRLDAAGPDRLSAPSPGARGLAGPDGLGDGPLAARLLGVRLSYGLADVVTGRMELGQVTRNAPTNPRLRLVTTGGGAGAVGLPHSQALREVLDLLRQEAEYIVIAAPSTSSGAEAQSLASHADAALVVVELGETRYTEVTDAAAQLGRIGTPVLGAVLLARAPRRDLSSEPALSSEPSLPSELSLSPERGGAPRAADAQPRPPMVATRSRTAAPATRSGLPASARPRLLAPRPHGPGSGTGHPSADDTPTTIIERAGLHALLVLDEGIDRPGLRHPAGEHGAPERAIPEHREPFETLGELRTPPASGPGRNGRPAHRADRSATREVTAAAMLAALTEDGPLDGAR